MWMDNEERGLGPDTGFYFKWNIDSDGKPRGCPGFPSGWKDAQFRHHAWLQPKCPKQDADDGTGQELWKTVENFADDNELWMSEFVASFEKMQTNGYAQLDQGPTKFWKHLQTEVKFNNVLQVIPKWGAQFRVSAYITVTDSLIHKRENIFHFTQGGSKAQYGDRIPAMWANRNGYFTIVSAVSGDNNHRFDYPYNLGKQYHVVIQQHLNSDGKVMYEIIIDGLLKHAVENNLPRDFTNVKAYVSNKWQKPFDGLVEDFEFTDNSPDWKQTEVKFNNVIQTIPKWGAQFRVSAYITVTDSHFIVKRENIFHFTQGESKAQYGDRIPAMWADRNGYFRIISAVSGDKNHRFVFPYDLGRQYHVLIQQHLNSGGKVMYKIIIDGLLMYEIENTLPQNFTNVKVYLSNKWQQPFDGLVTDFEFTDNPSDWNNVLLTQPPKCKATIINYGPMSKIRSDIRVRARGFISKRSVRGIARVRGHRSKTSGSGS